MRLLPSCLILLVLLGVETSAQSNERLSTSESRRELRDSHQSLQRHRQQQAREIGKSLSSYKVLRRSPSEIEAQVRGSEQPLELQLNGETFRFRMEQRNLLSPRYHAEVTGEDGVRRQLPPEPVTTFKGTVTGQEHIQGRFTITSDRFEGVVFTPGDWTFIEPMRKLHRDGQR